MKEHYTMYDAAISWMSTASNPSKGKPIANNTRLYVNLDGSFTMKLHGNPIITYTPNSITLRTCGWKTVTTKARMNGWSPKGLKVVQKNNVWWVQIGDEEYELHDEFTISYDLIRKLNEVKE